MTKFTAQENATRKEVFNYNRNRRSWDDSCTKKFGKSKAVRQAIIDSNKRMESHLPTLSEHQRFFRSLAGKADAMAKCLPSSGYSMGEYKYITNRLYAKLVNKDGYYPDRIGSCDNTQEYRGSRYRANHGKVEAELPVGLLAKGEVMHGMITIRTKQVQKRIWKCQWVVWDYDRNKRGFITSEITWHMENGYVVQCDEGLRDGEFAWYHCNDLATARQKLKSDIKWKKAEEKKRKEREAERKAEEKEKKRQQKEQEKADKLERASVMVHGKNYTQQEVNRAAWKIFGKIATRQESCLYIHGARRDGNHNWNYGYWLKVDENDAFECAVQKAFDAICKEHDVVRELSKHNQRERAAKYRPKFRNILQHEMVKNRHRATDMDESRWCMSLPGAVIYADSNRDKRIFNILFKKWRRQMAEKHEAVVKSSELADALQHMYVYRDSIAAGNCVPGTDGFIRDHGLQKTDTRSGEFLLRISRKTWQHANVARIVERYINITYPDFYRENQRTISAILSTL